MVAAVPAILADITAADVVGAIMDVTTGATICAMMDVVVGAVAVFLLLDSSKSVLSLQATC